MTNRELKIYVKITGLYLLLVIVCFLSSLFFLFKNNFEASIFFIILTFVLSFKTNNRMNSLKLTKKKEE